MCIFMNQLYLSEVIFLYFYTFYQSGCLSIMFLCVCPWGHVLSMGNMWRSEDNIWGWDSVLSHNFSLGKSQVVSLVAGNLT